MEGGEGVRGRLCACVEVRVRTPGQSAKTLSSSAMRRCGILTVASATSRRCRLELPPDGRRP